MRYEQFRVYLNNNPNHMEHIDLSYLKNVSK